MNPTIEETKRYFKQASEYADSFVKKLGGADKSLTEKIERVKKGAQEVVHHIEERTSPQKNG